MVSRINKLLNTNVDSIENTTTVDFSKMSSTLHFPLLAKASKSGINLKAWIDENNDEFKHKLKTNGAILFRGFAINTVQKFQNLVTLFAEKPLEYKMRSSPRYAVGNNVYHTTTYPNEYSINMHSESSYDPDHPNHIVFCCIQPAEERGETPIADNRLVLSGLTEATREKFLQKGIQYVRNLTSSLGLPWREVFQTQDKTEVEAICKEKGITCTWQNDDKLTLTWSKKAIWKHPYSNDDVWFNHGFFFNKYALDEDFLSLIDSDDDLPNNTSYGDGTEISKEEIEEIKEAYAKATFEFPWETGDVLFLDNMLMSHGRNPYKGDRNIIVSIF
jgi:alpha-ketoglutarate-dependent taurine dioxygenase